MHIQPPPFISVPLPPFPSTEDTGFGVVIHMSLKCQAEKANLATNVPNVHASNTQVWYLRIVAQVCQGCTSHRKILKLWYHLPGSFLALIAPGMRGILPAILGASPFAPPLGGWAPRQLDAQASLGYKRVMFHYSRFGLPGGRSGSFGTHNAT